MYNRLHLLPSRVTALRSQMRLTLPEAAAALGMPAADLRYIEDHTQRLSRERWAAIREWLTPIMWEGDVITPISIFDWFAEHDAAGDARREGGEG